MAAKYAIVTGGGRGIGLQVATKLLQQGKPVILATRDPTKGAPAGGWADAAGEPSAARARSAPGPRPWHAGAAAARKLAPLGEVHHMPLDVSSRNSISRFAEEVAAKRAVGTLVRRSSLPGSGGGGVQ